MAIPSTSQTINWLRHRFFGGDEHGTVAQWITDGKTADDLFAGGAVVQQVRATITATESTTSGTAYQATSLEATITPQHADSIIVAEFHGEGETRAVGTSNQDRRGFYRIFNVTDGASVVEQVVGRQLVSGSSAAAPSYTSVALRGEHEPGGTDPLTFRVEQYSVGVPDGYNQTSINAVRAGGARLTLTEVRP